ncbi:MAG: GNAT family N-acetyltransferase [Rubrivivax sp.]
MTTASTPSPSAGLALRWVPIRALAARHRPRVLDHLLTLSPADRHLRFGHVASDSQIARYVDQIDFDTDEVFGIFNRRLEVVAMAHLARLAGDGNGRSAEFGVSVAAGARGRGWGRRLFEHAVLHARNRGVDTLLIQALVENAAMLHIARAAGAQIEASGPDAVARLKLPPEDLASHVEELVEHQAAEWDYGVKVHSRRVDAWLRLMGATPPVPREDPEAARPEARDHAAPPAV